MWLFSGALAVAVLAGIALPVPLWCFPLLLLAGLLLRTASPALAAGLWLLAGFLWGAAGLDQAQQARLPASLEGETLRIQGRVADIPEAPGDGAGERWHLVLDRVRPLQAEPAALWPGGHRVRLSAPAHAGDFRGGDELELDVRLRRPRGRVNEGGMDSARLDLARGVGARGSLVERHGQQRSPASLQALRQRVSDDVRQRAGDHPVAARLLPALVAGDRRHLEDSDWRLLQRTGTAHLMAISGLHVSLVAGLTWWLARWLLAPLIPRDRPTARQLAVVPALLVACGYAALAGFALPTVRALAMNLVALAALALRLRPALPAALGVALLAVLLLDPVAVLDNSFWLSFTAVALLLLLAMAAPGGGRTVTAVRVQLVLALGLGAVTGWLFLHWGLFSPLANLVMVPLFSLLVVPLALPGALLPGAGVLFDAAGVILEAGWWLLVRLDEVSPLLPPPPNLVAVVLVMVAVLVPAVPRLGLPPWLALVCCLPWLWPAQHLPESGGFDLVVLDVGQGQALAVRTRNHLVLYDAGPAWPGGDAGRAVVRPWLRRQRQPVSLAIISHGGQNHAGGLAGLRDLLPEDALYSGEPDRVPGARACRRGQRWRFDGVEFRVLWPSPGPSLEHSGNRSCVVRVRGEAGSALLTGGIRAPVEYWLAAHEPEPVTVLQAPAHGSARASRYTFLRALDPRHAFASAGHGNPFGHPAERTRHRYETLGIPLVVTADSGMIVFRLRPSHNAAPLEWRRRHPRPWRD